MQLHEQTQATLLLTAWFGKQDNAGAIPLTPTEWGRFALFLRDASLTPADLLRTMDVDTALAGFNDKKITSERIRRLLDRSAALGIALEKWQRAGLWVMTRSDGDYPRLWKQRLKHDAPAVLFGAGNRHLLNRGGIAVVGSRDLDESQVAFTGRLGHDIAYQGQTVISGGARGADEASMLGALAADGMAVGVLADSLLRASTSSKYRKALMSNDLTLVSPFNPEAGFNAGNAMARNKYIYCMSDAAIVIAATENKGGTWAGAIENLKHCWVPLWVRRDNRPGNKALVEKGSHWLPGELDVLQMAATHSKAGGPPAAHHVAEEAWVMGPAASQGNQPVPSQDVSKRQEANPGEDASKSDAVPHAENEPKEAPYRTFLRRLVALLSEKALSLKELLAETGIRQKQLSEWLKQAEIEGAIAKTRSPVRYFLRTDGGGDKCPPPADGSGKAGTPQTGFEF